MAKNDDARDRAGREAYEANLRNVGGFAANNAPRWDDLDQATKDRWIEQAEADQADGVTEDATGEPSASSAEKTTAKASKATKATGAKADTGKAAGE